MRWLNKMMTWKIPDGWNDPNGLFYNLIHLAFWAIVFGIVLAGLALFG